LKTPPEPPHRLLILKLSSIGDVVMAMPVAVALKRAYPDLWITWAAQAPAAQVLSGHPAVNEVLPVRRPQHGGLSAAWFYAREWLRLAPTLRNGKFDVAVDLQGLFKAAVLGCIARAPRRLGFADERRELNRRLNNIPVEAAGVHAVDRYLQMARALGAEPYPVDFAFPAPPEADVDIEELLGAKGLLGEHLVALIPFASDTHKCWPGERFAQVAKRLTRQGLRCVIIGGAQDIQAAEEIADAAGGGVVSLAGRTNLLQVAALLRRCRLVIGNDTGPLHIAAAVGTPVLGLYGPTDPNKVGPYGWLDYVLWHRLPCAPCGRKPTCSDYMCMTKISVDEVLERASAMLHTQSTAAPDA